jgi:hypothetical protein
MQPLTRLTLAASLAALLLAPVTTAQADVYKSVDKYGNVTYTDDPSTAQKSGKAKKVQVRPTNVMPAGKELKAARSRPEPTPQSKHPNYNIRIVSPTDEHTVTAGQRDLIVAVSLQAPLTRGAKIAFYMDGKLLGKGTVNNYSIREIFRGEHNIYAQVESRKGKVLSKSDTVTVYVHRPSLLN